MLVYDIAQDDQYGWFDAMVRNPPPSCNVCGTALVPHMYGPILHVCPVCFPEEVQA